MSLKFQKKSIRFIGIVNQQNTKALCIQAYNIARAKLDKELLKDHNKNLSQIVADLDETVLNNTPFNEMLLEEDLTYNQDLWSTWVNKKIATAVPGSIEFFNYASKKNVEIIYLSNRLVENYQPTKENLIEWGFLLMIQQKCY